MKKSIIINLLLALVMAPLGIEAKKKAKTVEVPQLINYPSAELGEYRLHGGNVVIQGRIVAPEEYCKPDWSNKVYEKGPDSLMLWKDEQVAHLDELVRQMNNGLPELAGCSPLASDILRTHILAMRLQQINDYYMRGENLLRNDSTIDREAYWQHRKNDGRNYYTRE